MKGTKLTDALKDLPTQIVEALEKEYGEMESRFARRDWAPAELSGGRFAEGMLRYMEWKESGGKYTPIGTQINRQKVVNKVRNNGGVPEGIRYYMLGCAEILMDIRNKRDVAHLGDIVDVDEMDSRLLLRMAKWALAEIIREESGLSPIQVQTLIDRLSSREFGLVEEIDGDLVVVASHLKASERALVALYHSFPEPIEISVLRAAVKYAHSTNFRRLLEDKAQNGIVYIKGDSVYLTQKGTAWVDKNIELRLEL